jgi:ABC-type transport system involved in multi-copper enzyme maturation permease subunit
MPVILIVLFITLFFGRLFSDGVIKNLMASGFKKRTIYLTSLLFTCIMNLVMLAISIGVFALFCLIYKWHPPIYLPMLSFIVLIDFLMALTVSSLVLAVLFASRKKTAALIAGFVVVFSMFFIPYTPPIAILETNREIENDFESERYKELRALAADYSLYAFESEFDLQAFTERMYYKDGEECFPVKTNLPEPVQRALVIMIYSDHALLRRTIGREYLLYRDGVYTVNAVCNVIWSVLFNTVGIVVFKKRELI